MDPLSHTVSSKSTPYRKAYPTAVKAWLVVGLFMIFMQVVVGGITRLTGSGLSITKWEIVTGTDSVSTGDQVYRAAFNQQDELVIGLILWADRAELDSLTDEVLRPALDAMTLRG